MSDRASLYLIDGHASFFRAYHAIRGGMSSPVTGEATHLTFGFAAMLLKLIRDERPEHLAVAIDASGDRGTFRSEIYPEYKANRESAPEDFHPQVERCLELLRLLAIPVFAIEGVEADDVIATIVRRMREEHPGQSVRIVSRDKDLTQIVGGGVELYDAQKDEVVTPDALFKTEGVQPEHVVDILALMGDTSDNVPGVPGIGPKTAAKLVLEHGSLDAVLAAADSIKGKRGEAIRACADDQIPLAKRLVILKDDVDVDFDLDEARLEPGRFDVPATLELFRTLNFNSHMSTLKEVAGLGGAAEPKAGGGAKVAAGDADEAPPAGSLFAMMAGDGEPAVEPALPEPNGAYDTIVDEDGLVAVLGEVAARRRAAVDTETDSLAARTAGLCGVSLAVEAERGVYVPVRSPDPTSHLAEADATRRMRPILEDPGMEIVGHNLKFDLNVLRRHGIVPAGRLVDTMVADYLLHPERSSHKMDALAEDLLGVRCVPITDLIGERKRGTTQKRFDEVPLERAAPYAAEDADITLRLADALTPKLAEAGLERLYRDVEMPLVRVIAEMEWNGIRVDPDELDRQRDVLIARIERLVEEIAAAAPHEFDPNSPAQLGAALFNGPEDEPPGLGLPVVKRSPKTKKPSTDAEVLDKLAGDPTIDSPIPRLIVEYRQLTKLVSTYLVALKEAINPETGRIHASFNQTVAATGRLSSSDPNLQNIPIRTDVGRAIRRAFVADPDHELIAADYSQIELRVLAHLSGDEALIAAFHAGADIHRAVAAEVFGIDPEDVSDEQRGSAKMVNFGIVYGVTAFGLERRLGGRVDRAGAQKIIDDYKARFAGIETFLEACKEEARETGSVRTILGRRRPIETIHSRNPAQRALGERTAINTVVQGSAADLIKVAMVDLHAAMPPRFPEARMLLQIHDELVFEAPAAIAADVERFVVERMEAAMDLTVPLEAGSARGASWIDAK